MIVPGLMGFAGVKKPIVRLDRFRAVRNVRIGGPREAQVAREIIDDGGVVWTFSKPATTNTEAHFIADDLMINAGTFEALTTGDDPLERRTGFRYTDLRVSGSTPNVFFSGDNPEQASGFVSTWSFAKHPRFFDIVRWTGDGEGNRQIQHSLDRAPGMIMVKRTDAIGAWRVYHNKCTASPENVYLDIGSNAAAVTDANVWNNTAPNENDFTVGSALNASVAEYIAFIFADDDRGNGCIRTGSYTGGTADGVPLQFTGWQPRLVFVKSTTAAESWRVYYADGFGADQMQPGIFLDDRTNYTVSTTDTISVRNGWETKTVFKRYDTTNGSNFTVPGGDDGMNTTGEDYVWMAVRYFKGNF